MNSFLTNLFMIEITYSTDCYHHPHVHGKVPFGYNDALLIRPQKYPFPWSDRQTPLLASSLGPSHIWRQTASGSDPPFFHNALDRPTDWPTERPTDRPRESLMTIAIRLWRERRGLIIMVDFCRLLKSVVSFSLNSLTVFTPLADRHPLYRRPWC